MLEAMRKFFDGVGRKDNKVIEAAVKDMLQDEGKVVGEDEKMEAEADSMVKHMLQAKKEMKKEDGESEEAYEAKVVKAAMKAMADAKKEAADKKDHAEPDADDKGGASDKDADDKKEAADKKDEKPADKGDDGDHADKAQDVALIKKMMKQMDEMKAKMEQMEKKHEAEAKSAHESAAKAETELTIKNREAMIETKLAKSGLRRDITALWKPVLVKCKTEKEIDETVAKMKETASKALEELFETQSSIGLVERASKETKSNDELFD